MLFVQVRRQSGETELCELRRRIRDGYGEI